MSLSILQGSLSEVHVTNPDPTFVLGLRENVSLLYTANNFGLMYS
jgi:hypothetical protein